MIMMWLYIVGGIVTLLGGSVFFGAPYLPTKRRDVERLFREGLKLSKKDVVLDIGSGDGVVLRAAARCGAKAVGYEIHPLFMILSKFLSAGYKSVAIKLTNGWTESFPDDVTLVYIFSANRDVKRLVRTMKRETKRLNRPLRLVSYGIPILDQPVVRKFEAYSVYEFAP